MNYLDLARSKISEITNSTTILNNQRKRLEKLVSQGSLTLKFIKSECQENRYSCAVYALDLVNDEYYEHIAAGEPEAFASPEFIAFLIRNNYLEECKPLDEECFIVYKNESKIKHIGIRVPSGRVKSKWGLGLLCEHETFEIPYEYGDKVKYYSLIDKELVLDYFIEFAKSKGIKFQD